MSNLRKNMLARNAENKHTKRAMSIINMLNTKPVCINQWVPTTILGVGTVGTVFLSCKKNNTKTCAAMKIQLIENKDDETLFKEEIKKQKSFKPYAPTVYDTCIILDKNETKYGIIIMETLGTELDSYLTKKLTTTKLLKVVDDITEILVFCKKNKLTHGDLALFNIAFNSKNNLVFLDFDRASNKFYPLVDYLRLHIEMFVKTQSKGTKKLNNDNLKFLQKHLWRWAEALDLQVPKLTANEMDEFWVREYSKYCVAAGVKCLE